MSRTRNVFARQTEWLSYVPVITQDGTPASVEVINNVIRYKVIDNTVFLQGQISIGRLASGAGGTFVRVSLPIPGKVSTNQAGIGLVTKTGSTENGGMLNIASSNVSIATLRKFGDSANFTAGDASTGFGMAVLMNGSYEID